ncbi:MAG: ATP synthase F0 subunit C [Candidatus Dependentiae bacterium]|nr:ATP synthase F0 subunit C [Candidatus Dependentiae bacterium]
MSELSEFLHYGTIALGISMNAIGVGIGQGLTGKAALTAINMQPSAQSEITKTAILGITLIETSAVMGALISFLVLRVTHQNSFSGLAELGIAFAICLPGIVIGIVSSWPAQSSCMAIARQPFLAQRISRFMAITQALIQAPVLFGLLIALFISTQASMANSLFDSLRLIGAGLCIGLGSIGPAIGLALFSRTACYGQGINPKAGNTLLSFTFISAPLIETPIIFALIVSLTLLFAPGSQHETIDGIALLAAGLCTGLGTFGAGIGSGLIASAACNQIALNPDSHSVIARTSMFGQAFIETGSIYAILISLVLIFFR